MLMTHRHLRDCCHAAVTGAGPGTPMPTDNPPFNWPQHLVALHPAHSICCVRPATDPPRRPAQINAPPGTSAAPQRHRHPQHGTALHALMTMTDALMHAGIRHSAGPTPLACGQFWQFSPPHASHTRSPQTTAVRGQQSMGHEAGLSTTAGRQQQEGGEGRRGLVMEGGTGAR
jgi:hypothetical protein